MMKAKQKKSAIKTKDRIFYLFMLSYRLLSPPTQKMKMKFFLLAEIFNRIEKTNKANSSTVGEDSSL